MKEKNPKAVFGTPHSTYVEMQGVYVSETEPEHPESFTDLRQVHFLVDGRDDEGVHLSTVALISLEKLRKFRAALGDLPTGAASASLDTEDAKVHIEVHSTEGGEYLTTFLFFDEVKPEDELRTEEERKKRREESEQKVEVYLNREHFGRLLPQLDKVIAAYP